MSWANTYVGVPFADLGRTHLGCDCWGLARLVYREQLGIDLPSCAQGYSSSAETAEVSKLLSARSQAPWSEVTGTLQAFDLLLFRRGSADSHIGIVVSKRAMLHMASGDHAKVESQLAPRWSARLIAAYRHQAAPFNDHLTGVS